LRFLISFTLKASLLATLTRDIANCNWCHTAFVIDYFLLNLSLQQFHIISIDLFIPNKVENLIINDLGCIEIIDRLAILALNSIFLCELRQKHVFDVIFMRAS
jgi:hypothetical protein